MNFDTYSSTIFWSPQLNELLFRFLLATLGKNLIRKLVEKIFHRIDWGNILSFNCDLVLTISAN